MVINNGYNWTIEVGKIDNSITESLKNLDVVKLLNSYIKAGFQFNMNDILFAVSDVDIEENFISLKVQSGGEK